MVLNKLPITLVSPWKTSDPSLKDKDKWHPDECRLRCFKTSFLLEAVSVGITWVLATYGRMKPLHPAKLRIPQLWSLLLLLFLLLLLGIQYLPSRILNIVANFTNSDGWVWPKLQLHQEQLSLRSLSIQNKWPKLRPSIQALSVLYSVGGDLRPTYLK